jgi:hypothetical protein
MRGFALMSAVLLSPVFVLPDAMETAWVIPLKYDWKKALWGRPEDYPVLEDNKLGWTSGLCHWSKYYIKTFSF